MCKTEKENYYNEDKRGVTLEATYFHARPYTSERAKQKVIDLAKGGQYSGQIKLHVPLLRGQVPKSRAPVASSSGE